MFTIGYAAYLFVICTVLAILEVQIEGPWGWAEKAPCWRPKPESRVARWYARAMGGKPLTGYHIAIFSLVAVILHFPFAAGNSWSLIKELETLSAMLITAVCWDFLWFLWNPAYGLSRFDGDHISLHKNWIGPIPRDYLNGLVLSFLFALIANLISGQSLMGWLFMSAIVTAGTAVTAVATRNISRT